MLLIALICLLVSTGTANANWHKSDRSPNRQEHVSQITTVKMVDGSSAPRLYRHWATGLNVPAVPEVNLTFDISLCGADAQGCSFLNAATPTLAIDTSDCDPSDKDWCHAAFVHELGHLFDKHYLTDIDHAQFARILHRKLPTDWWDEGDYADTLSEWLAEGYRRCAYKHAGYITVTNYHPTRHQRRKVCRLLRLG